MTEKIPSKKELKIGSGGHHLSVQILKAVGVYGVCAGIWHWVLFLVVRQ